MRGPPPHSVAGEACDVRRRCDNLWSRTVPKPCLFLSKVLTWLCSQSQPILSKSRVAPSGLKPYYVPFFWTRFLLYMHMCRPRTARQIVSDFCPCLNSGPIICPSLSLPSQNTNCHLFEPHAGPTLDQPIASRLLKASGVMMDGS